MDPASSVAANRLVVDRRTPRGYVVDRLGRPRQVSIQLADLLDRYIQAGSSADLASSVDYVRDLIEPGRKTWCVVRDVPSPHLRRVQVEIASRCNLSCFYCFSSTGPEDQRKIPREQVMNHIAQADRAGVVGIDLTGGEPLLDPDWRDYVAEIRSRGIAVNIHTNGTLVTDDDVAFLSGIRVAGINVSLDSHIPEVNDRARGVPGALSSALEGATLIYDAGLPLQVTIMAHVGNRDTLSRTVQNMSRRFARAVINVDRVVDFGRSGPLQTDEPYLTEEEFWHIMRPYLSDQVATGRVCKDAAFGESEPHCGVGSSSLYITSEGELAACPTMNSRIEGMAAGPNGKDVPVDEGWLSASYFAELRGSNCGAAAKCEVGRHCGGGCRSNAYQAGGKLDSPDQFQCNIRRNSTTTWVDFLGRYRAGNFEPVWSR